MSAINNLKELVQPYLTQREKRFISYESKYFLPPGENYGSTILAVKIKVKNRNDVEETIDCVAKMLPISERIQKHFNVSVTFKKEIVHYNTVVPTLNEFGKEMGFDNLMNFSAPYVGGRISLKPDSDIIDKDAVIILEDLKIQGYIVGDRFEGFDMDTSKLILKDLANMHASVIAFKLIRPEKFKSKILSNLGEAMTYVPPDSMLDLLVENILKHASRNPKCLPLLDRIAIGTRKMRNVFVYSKVREPFATLAQADMWANNILTKYENGKAIGNVFLDFALCKYASPARDILFFIYSSAHLELIPTKVDELIRFYYEKFIETLSKFKCDTGAFTYELFLEELDIAGKDIEFSQCMFMLTPIYTLPSQAKDMTEWTPEHLSPNEDMLHPNFHVRLHKTILDFAERNWI